MLESIEYFYLETPQIPDDKFPIKVYGIFDRITIDDAKISRLKEDIIKILAEVKKFGVLLQDAKPDAPKVKNKNMEEGAISRYTDKMYSPDIDATYPEFTPQHFSPNRQE